IGASRKPIALAISSLARMTTWIWPPTRGSTSAIGLVKPSGPNHWASSFGSVHALKTRSRGASNTRTMESSRLCTCVIVVVPPLPARGSAHRLGIDDHPGRAPAVHDRAEFVREECLFHLHGNAAAFGQRLEDALGFVRRIDVQCDMHAGGLGVAHVEGVRGHQLGVADLHIGVN